MRILGRKYTMVIGALVTMAFFFAYTAVSTPAQNVGFSCAIAFCINIYYGTLYAVSISLERFSKILLVKRRVVVIKLILPLITYPADLEEIITNARFSSTLLKCYQALIELQETALLSAAIASWESSLLWSTALLILDLWPRFIYVQRFTLQWLSLVRYSPLSHMDEGARNVHKLLLAMFSLTELYHQNASWTIVILGLKAIGL